MSNRLTKVVSTLLAISLLLAVFAYANAASNSPLRIVKRIGSVGAAGAGSSAVEQLMQSHAEVVKGASEKPRKGTGDTTNAIPGTSGGVFNPGGISSANGISNGNGNAYGNGNGNGSGNGNPVHESPPAAVNISANGSHGTEVLWLGAGGLAAFTPSLANLAPGHAASGDVIVAMEGHVRATVTAAVSGTDIHPDSVQPCFGFWLREVAATGTTKADVEPVMITGLGVGAGSDAHTVPFAVGANERLLPDVDSDRTWETDDAKRYRLTVRALSGCTQGSNGQVAPTGSVRVVFRATQWTGK